MTDMLGQGAVSLTTFPLSIVVKSTGIVAGALLTVRWMRRRPASTRHLVLASAFAFLLLLPLAEMLVPTVTIPVGPIEEERSVALPITIAAPPDTAPVGPAATATGAPAPTSSLDALSPLGFLLIGWAAGALGCLGPVLLTRYRLRQLRKTARRWNGGDALARSLGARSAVTVLVHDAVYAPFTCGVVWPAIVLPSAALQWSGQELTQALVHELEHVRRADWPVHVATRMICALYWFHPLVWVAWRRLCLEAERACDDAVLRVGEPTTYAQQLVTLARRTVKLSPRPVLSMAGPSDLSARIGAVLDGTQARAPLSLTRAVMGVAAAALLAAAVAPLRAAQIGQPAPSPAATVPAFDVVSIRENKSGEAAQRIRRQPGRITASNYPLRGLILTAYGLQPQQLVGGPDWIDSARYDITALVAGELPVTEPGTIGPLQLMMQRMLADRFQLAVHTETRELPIYALTVARSDRRLGPSIRPAATDCETLIREILKGAQSGGALPPPPQRADGGPACGIRFDGRRLAAGGTSMAALARNLAGPTGRLVEDRTGLTGALDFELEFTADPGFASPAVPPQAADANVPSIFTALQEQLGLKLEPIRAPVAVLVIDRVEPPTEN